MTVARSLGILNARVADFVFRRIAKVKAGGFFEANRQFIAPLPIPPARPEERASIAERARALQDAHTARRNTLASIRRRLSAVRTRNRRETWLFPGLKPEEELLAEAPARLDQAQKTEWAARRYHRDLAAYHDAITVRLRPGSALAAAFENGELSFAIDGVPVIAQIFVSPADGEFIAAQWKVCASTFRITERADGEALSKALRRLASAGNPEVVRQVIALERELSALEADIAHQEAAMNTLVYRLYALTNSEIKMVEHNKS